VETEFRQIMGIHDVTCIELRDSADQRRELAERCELLTETIPLAIGLDPMSLWDLVRFFLREDSRTNTHPLAGVVAALIALPSFELRRAHGTGLCRQASGQSARSARLTGSV
jgi:hypothetical protein